MFGHSDDPQAPKDNTSTDGGAPTDAPSTAPSADNSSTGSDSAPSYMDDLAKEPAGDVTTPADDTPGEPVESPEPVEEPVSPMSAPAGPAPCGDLIDIKQQALSELSPLLGHLDQPPEERFRTTMMLIQASDNQSLIPQAYEAAKQITDEKVRAQALLDIVNEINYFTQNNQSN
jgi:hypothetical protein